MRIQNLLLCALLALPALAVVGDEKAKLRTDLASTLGAITEFTGLQQRIAARDSSAIRELLAASEAAPADSIQTEVELVALRARVAALQEILDVRSIESGQLPLSKDVVAPQPPPIAAEVSPSAAPTPVPAIVTPPTVAVPNKIAFEADGFVADRSRLGRACWRGGRYAEGIAALEPLTGDPRADYWRARCLEKLARNAEALQLYRHVIEVASESPEGRSAREDLEFLEWSMSHGLVSTP